MPCRIEATRSDAEPVPAAPCETADTGVLYAEPPPGGMRPAQLQALQPAPGQSSADSALRRDVTASGLTETLNGSLLSEREDSQPQVATVALEPGPGHVQTQEASSERPLSAAGAVSGAAAHGADGQVVRIGSAKFSAMAGLGPPICLTQYAKALAAEEAARQPTQTQQ